MEEDCLVCCEKFNTSQRKKIVCFKCNYIACKKCHTRYILDHRESAHCMKCSIRWTDLFLSQNFTKKFIQKDYLESRINYALVREKSLLPMIQTHIDPYKTFIDDFKNKFINILYSNSIYKVYDQVTNESLIGILPNKIELYNEIMEINIYTPFKDILRLIDYKNILPLGDTLYISNKIRLLLNHNIDYINTGFSNLDKKNTKKHTTFMCQNDECNGFVDDNFKCSLCNFITCKKCYKIKDNDEHECNEDDIKTANVLKKNTKPCPNCGVFIYKIDGCDMMYCTKCFVPFLWRTLEIYKGKHIHNPHYFENNQRIGQGIVQRQRNDMICGGFPELINYRSIFYGLDSQVRPHVITYIRIVSEITQEIIPKYVFNNEEFIMPRILFMLKQITEKEWFSKIKMLEKKQSKYRDFREILSMVFETGSHIILKIFEKFDLLLNKKYTTNNEKKKIHSEIYLIMDEFEGLLKYMNEQLLSLKLIYNNKVPQIKKNHFRDDYRKSTNYTVSLL